MRSILETSEGALKISGHRGCICQEDKDPSERLFTDDVKLNLIPELMTTLVYIKFSSEPISVNMVRSYFCFAMFVPHMKFYL
jgi:hypothetical protein